MDETEYSLEMQIWWRDHQKADKKRIQQELKKRQQQLKENKEKFDLNKALEKLTPYERRLINERHK